MNKKTIEKIKDCLLQDQKEIQDVNIMSISEIPSIEKVIGYIDILKNKPDITIKDLDEIGNIIQQCCEINDLETGNCFMYKSDYTTTFNYIEKIKKML